MGYAMLLRLVISTAEQHKQKRCLSQMGNNCNKDTDILYKLAAKRIQ